MESLSKIKHKIHFIWICICCTYTISAQKVINYHDLKYENDATLLVKVDAFLNATNQFSPSSIASFNKSNEKQEILAISYHKLANISEIPISQLNQLKYCVLKIQNNSSTIDLNLLNTLKNLEFIHIIIETNFTDTPSVINLNNKNIVVTFTLSVPQ